MTTNGERETGNLKRNLVADFVFLAAGRAVVKTVIIDRLISLRQIKSGLKKTVRCRKNRTSYRTANAHGGVHTRTTRTTNVACTLHARTKTVE